MLRAQPPFFEAFAIIVPDGGQGHSPEKSMLYAGFAATCHLGTNHGNPMNPQRSRQRRYKEIPVRMIASILGLSVAMTVATTAMAQGSTKMHCQMIGNNAPEQLGQDQSIMVSNFSCRIEGGPLDKGIATGSQVYEFKGSSGTGRAGHGVVRAADGLAVYVNQEMKYDLQMANGKVTGATGSGRGSYTMATGSAKELAGKPYTYTWSTTGPSEFTLEVR